MGRVLVLIQVASLRSARQAHAPQNKKQNKEKQNPPTGKGVRTEPFANRAF